MDERKISIIMPNYNGEKYLEKAIISFLNQNYKNKELIIIDGKSKDNSHKIISKFIKKYPTEIIWVKKKDRNYVHASNIGVKKASGNIIGYMGNDDFYLPNILKKIIFFFNFLKDVDGIYFDSYTYNLLNNGLIYRACPKLKFNKLNLFKYGTLVGLQNIFFKKEIFLKYQFNEKYPCCFDYEFYIKILKDYKNFYHIKQPSSINIYDGTNLGSGKECFKQLLLTMKNTKSTFKENCVYIQKELIFYIKKFYHIFK